MAKKVRKIFLIMVMKSGGNSYPVMTEHWEGVTIRKVKHEIPPTVIVRPLYSGRLRTSNGEGWPHFRGVVSSPDSLFWVEVV